MVVADCICNVLVKILNKLVDCRLKERYEGNLFGVTWNFMIYGRPFTSKRWFFFIILRTR